MLNQKKNQKIRIEGITYKIRPLTPLDFLGEKDFVPLLFINVVSSDKQAHEALDAFYEDKSAGEDQITKIMLPMIRLGVVSWNGKPFVYEDFLQHFNSKFGAKTILKLFGAILDASFCFFSSKDQIKKGVLVKVIKNNAVILDKMAIRYHTTPARLILGSVPSNNLDEMVINLAIMGLGIESQQSKIEKNCKAGHQIVMTLDPARD